MSKEKIDNLVNQLSASEHIALAEYIERQYAIEYKGEGVLRDDIRDRIFELIKSNFTSLKFIVQEHYTWMDMEMNPDEVNALSEMLMIEFGLESIEFSRVMEWQRVSDVISYIEDALECVLYDAEETQPPASESW